MHVLYTSVYTSFGESRFKFYYLHMELNKIYHSIFCFLDFFLLFLVFIFLWVSMCIFIHFSLVFVVFWFLKLFFKASLNKILLCDYHVVLIIWSVSKICFILLSTCYLLKKHMISYSFSFLIFHCHILLFLIKESFSFSIITEWYFIRVEYT